ncbi:type II toxin-antitoxin system HicA family toxin [Chloroflexota bacterium]
MTNLPALTGKEVTKALGKAGFQVLRQKGSHVYLKHADKGNHQNSICRGSMSG